MKASLSDSKTVKVVQANFYMIACQKKESQKCLIALDIHA